MNESSANNPSTPVGSFVLLALLYLPWLRYYLGPRAAPEPDGDMEFPGSIILVFFGLIYLVVAIALAVRLHRRRRLSTAHRVAFYASLGILVLLTTLLWTAL